MKANRKTLAVAVLAAAFLVGLILMAVWAVGTLERTAHAQTVTVVGLDMLPGGNSCPNDGTNCTLGAIDPCASTLSEGDEFDFDIFIENIALGDSVLGFGGAIGGDFWDGVNFRWPGTLVAQDITTNTIVIQTQPGSIAIPILESVPDPPGDDAPPHTLGFSDMGAAEYRPPFTHGVLARMTINVAGVPVGNYKLELAPGGPSGFQVTRDNPPGGVIFDPGGVQANGVDDDGDTTTDEDELWDGRFLGPAGYYGIIAVGQACPGAPEPTDLEKVSFAPGNFDLDDNGSYEEPYVANLDIPVSQNIWFEVDETVVNNGAGDNVLAEVTVTCEPPESIITSGTPGGECSYHVAATETVTVDGTLLTCTAPGALPILCSNNCTAGVCPVSTEIKVQWPHVLDVHKLTPALEIDVPQDLPTQEWDVHCYEPSTHVWHFENDIVAVDPASFPESLPGNNHKEFDLTLDCLAEANLEVTNALVSGLDTGLIGEPFNLTVSATVTNLGTWDPVSAEAKFDLDLTGTDCTRIPDDFQTVDYLNLGGPLFPFATWSVTCNTLTTETFGGTAEVILDDDTHISDPISGNNGPIAATTKDVTIVAEQADVFVVSWAIAEDDLPNSGSQVLIVPGTPATITTQQIMDNAGPDGPAATDDNRSVADVAGVCVVTNNDRTTSYPLDVDDPVGLNETWSVSWIDDPKPPYWCDLTFVKTLTITDPGFSDPDSNNNTDSVSVQVVLDSDGDGIPDDGDLSGSDTNDPCQPGESTFCDDNCEDVINPGQEDIEGDGIGDACDADNDNDGICDPGESAAYCTGSDNCPLKYNPGQEDSETPTPDGIGDVCELDVNCTNNPLTDPDITDAVMILQYIVDLADASPTACPPPAGWLYGPRMSAYIAYPDGGTIIDALMVLQCIVGRNNIVCPLVP